MNNRKRLVQGISSIARFIPTSWLQSVHQQQLILPFYHTVSDTPLKHLKHLYPIKNKNSFIKDLDFLLKYYHPISLQDLQSHVQKGHAFSKPSFLLSFDDGLREFNDVIAPILLRKGIPATCFLNSSFIGNKELFYRYKASVLIEHLTNHPKLLSKPDIGFSTVNSFSAKVLSIGYNRRTDLNKLAQLLEYSFDDYLKKQKPYMNTDEILSLIEKGFHFGAHSIDHPEYQFISFNEQIRQTKESLKAVTELFQLDYSAFSFPFTDYGVSNDFFQKMIKDATVDLTFGSAGQKKKEFSIHFQRIPFEMNKLSGKTILNTELFYYLLKMPLGKNRITRT